MAALPASLRFLRYLYSASLGIIAVLALAGETLLPAKSAAPPVIVNLLYAMAAADVFLVIFFRRRFSAPALKILRDRPDDSAALVEWMKGQFIPLPLALGIGLMGMASRVVGAPAVKAAPLYLVALALLVAFWPADPQA